MGRIGRSSIVWALLVGATLGSFSLAEFVPARSLAVPAIMLIAAIKIRLIVRSRYDPVVAGLVPDEG